ncbi:MAG TPA: sigma factor-like helix-turn-helix DNA-binding protein [Streptosporangiaceae bacterium]|nr:sigma factor-like helix-turn-helix DNA-binding protein [Streptosporangiaceae bacterium]
MTATARGSEDRMAAAGARRAFPAGTGSEEPGALNRAADCDVAEQALRAVRTEHLRHRIREVLAALPDEQRRAVRFRLFEGLGDAEIAPVLGVTPQRVSELWNSGFTTLWSALRADPSVWLGDEEGSADSSP